MTKAMTDYFKNTLNEGVCELALPGQLSAESTLDVEDWLNLVIRRLRRNVAKHKPPNADTTQEPKP